MRAGLSTATDRSGAMYPIRREAPPIYNEQVKLAATLFNNLAAASWIGTLVAPLFTNQRLPWGFSEVVLFSEYCVTSPLK